MNMFAVYKDHSNKCLDEYANIRKYDLYKQKVETQKLQMQHVQQQQQQHQQYHHTTTTSSVNRVTTDTMVLQQQQQQQAALQAQVQQQAQVDKKQMKKHHSKESFNNPYVQQQQQQQQQPQPHQQAHQYQHAQQGYYNQSTDYNSQMYHHMYQQQQQQQQNHVQSHAMVNSHIITSPPPPPQQQQLHQHVTSYDKHHSQVIKSEPIVQHHNYPSQQKPQLQQQHLSTSNYLANSNDYSLKSQVKPEYSNIQNYAYHQQQQLLLQQQQKPSYPNQNVDYYGSSHNAYSVDQQQKQHSQYTQQHVTVADNVQQINLEYNPPSVTSRTSTATPLSTIQPSPPQPVISQPPTPQQPQSEPEINYDIDESSLIDDIINYDEFYLQTLTSKDYMPATVPSPQAAPLASFKFNSIEQIQNDLRNYCVQNNFLLS